MKKNKDLIVCKNCVMDTTDSSITFDENGVCDHCNTVYKHIKPNWDFSESGQNQIIKIADKIKKAADFDCIIGKRVVSIVLILSI